MKRFIYSSTEHRIKYIKCTDIDSAALPSVQDIEQFTGELANLFDGEGLWFNINTYKKNYYVCKYTAQGHIQLQIKLLTFLNPGGLGSFSSDDYTQFQSEYYINNRKGDPRTVYRDDLIKSNYDMEIRSMFANTLGKLGYTLIEYKYAFRPGRNNPDYLTFIFD